MKMFSSKIMKHVFKTTSFCNLCKIPYYLKFHKLYQPYVRTYSKCTYRNENISINFQKWILDYFKLTDNYSTTENMLSANEINVEEKHCIRILSDDELLKSMVNINFNKNHKMRNLYDDEWYHRIEKGLNLADSLRLLNYWLSVTPSRIRELKSYHMNINKISEIIKNQEITKQQLIEYVYFTSLMRNDPKAQAIMKSIVTRLARSPKLVEQFTLEEMCIFCNSVFTVSTKLKSPVLLDMIIRTIESNTDILLNKDAFLTALIKPLRHARYYNYSFLDRFVQVLYNANMQYGNFISKVHLLALYSDAAYSNGQFISMFCSKVLDDFEYCVSNNLLIRMKDINRFLWSVSHLRITEHKTRIRKLIIPHMMNQKTRLRKEPSNYLNSVLWLLMLHCETEELVKCMFTEKHLDLVLETKHVKNMVRASLLISAVEIQYNHLISLQILGKRQHQFQPNEKDHLNARPHLASIFNAIRCLSSCLGIHNVELCWRIPCLYIGGISIHFGSSSAEVEVLDDTVCLHNTNKPHGLMQFKLQLMQVKGYNIILIDNCTMHMDTECLYEYVEDYLRRKIEISQ